MSLERYIRMIAGTLILLSLLLAHFWSPYWLWFTAFVGANLFQSSLTRWCLMEDILRKVFHIRTEVEIAEGKSCCADRS